MGRFHQAFVRKLRIAVIVVLAARAAPTACASEISLQFANSSLSAASGGTVTFAGTVTNGSGGSLNASDFFFNFFGFDATSVNPIQDLGVVTDFSILNGTTTGFVALFDVNLGAVPAAP